MATFDLKSGLKHKPFNRSDYTDLATYLYTRCQSLREQGGKIIVLTEPKGGHIVSTRIDNAFIGAIFTAYNEHRHLVLKPDDVWIAIASAFSLYVNSHAEEMRDQLVNHEEKMELSAEEIGSLYTVNWQNLIKKFSVQIQKNTKGDIRSWIEPCFSTTTPTITTVSQVILMSVVKAYFDFSGLMTMCGIPKVTLEGTLKDWQEVQKKAAHLRSFNVDCLTKWAGLLEPILEKLVESFTGNVDKEFWSNICCHHWGSGEDDLSGWLNVFLPFTTEGNYRLNRAEPARNEWGMIDLDNIPPSVKEVPVLMRDERNPDIKPYATVFYSGHIVCVYNPTDDTIQPSLDWAIVDITESLQKQDTAVDDQAELSPELEHLRSRMRRFHGMRRHQEYSWHTFPKPATFLYGA